MATVLYTNTEAIRACAGVREVEFPDEVIAARNMEAELRLELASWLPTHATVAAAHSTTEEELLSDALSLYCANFCAASLLRPLAVLGKVSDGSNSMERAATAAEAAAAAGAAARRYRDVITQALTGAPAAPFSLLGLSEPSFDPITG